MTGQYSGLLYILVEAGIIRKEAMPSYSELLMAVKTLAETTSMAEQKDKCPECNDCGELYDRKEGLNYDCPTCTSTGEKKPDSPREKIAKPIPCRNICLHYKKCRPFVNPVLCTKLKFKPIIQDVIEPLIKDAREQEGKAIGLELEKAYRLNTWIERDEAVSILLQALKGE